MTTPITNPDLCIPLGNTTFNVRVVILVSTPRGYIFERHKTGFLFAIGGRVKLHESTMESAARELVEELGVAGVDLRIAGLVENFFDHESGHDYHELNVVYLAELESTPELSELVSEGENKGFIYVQTCEFDQHDIRPKSLLQVLSGDEQFVHVVNREN